NATAAAALRQQADAVYVRGFRIKVAVIAKPGDLGSIPSLFDKPADYARFLGTELSFVYVGPLLVVMPAGFGVYDGGRSTAAEDQVLRSVQVAAGSPDDLARSATAALQRLAAAGALRSPDVRPPLVTAYPASAIRGKPAALRFDVF